MRNRLSLLILVLAASLSVAPLANAQETMGAFTWFEKLCLANAGHSDLAADAARQAGWKEVHIAGGPVGVTGLTAFQAEDERGTSLLIMTIPAAALDSSASANACLVGEEGASESAMSAFLANWAGFAPEDDGGFEFWAVRTVDGVRVPERGLMDDLPGEEFVARVRDQKVSLIGVMPGLSGPAFVSMVPFL